MSIKREDIVFFKYCIRSYEEVFSIITAYDQKKNLMLDWAFIIALLETKLLYSLVKVKFTDTAHKSQETS